MVRVENPLCGTFSQREREKVVFGGGRSTTTVFRILGDCRAEAGARGVAVNESGQQRQKAAIFPAQEEKPCSPIEHCSSKLTPPNCRYIIESRPTHTNKHPLSLLSLANCHRRHLRHQTSRFFSILPPPLGCSCTHEERAYACVCVCAACVCVRRESFQFYILRLNSAN